MTANITPHLNFRGDARAALEFYHGVLGGEIALITYRDAHAVTDEAEADWIMWGQVAADGLRVMAFDVPGVRAYDQGVESYFMSLRGDDADEVRGLWERLRDGSTILQDLGPAAWSPLYGMLRDRFGVIWVVDATFTAA
ncbi:VOC family protein [Microbacterium sp. CJ88]|uniref:VOC family protein n=1 Tax=Microbacterium sp. CJ88 TaxID=3445672 RepID=UPI003F65F293